MNWTEIAQGLERLEPGARAQLARVPVQTVPADTVLFRPEEPVQGFVVVLSGRIEVFLTGPTGREILLYAVEPGQSCVQSTLGLLGGDAYSGEAVARSDCRVALIPRGLFLTLMGSSAAFREFVFAAFAHRMQMMIQLLEKVAFLRVESRLAETLLERAQDGAVAATHAELAAVIGTAREVVSRRLDALSRRGIVALDRGAVRLLDIEMLAQIARN